MKYAYKQTPPHKNIAKVKTIKLILRMDHPMYFPFEKILRAINVTSIITKYFTDGRTQASIKL